MEKLHNCVLQLKQNFLVMIQHFNYSLSVALWRGMSWLGGLRELFEFPYFLLSRHFHSFNRFSPPLHKAPSLPHECVKSPSVQNINML